MKSLRCHNSIIMFVAKRSHNEAVVEEDYSTVKAYMRRNKCHKSIHKLELVQSLYSYYRRLWQQQKKKYATLYLKMYDSGGARSPSRSSGSRHAQTQNIATQQHIATSIRKAERDQLQRLRGASISTPQLCRAALPHSLQVGGGGGAARFHHRRLPAPGLLPGVHLDVAARRRAGFPLVSVRHAAALYLLHWLRCAAALQTPERSGDAVIGCCLRRRWEK